MCALSLIRSAPTSLEARYHAGGETTGHNSAAFSLPRRGHAFADASGEVADRRNGPGHTA